MITANVIGNKALQASLLRVRRKAKAGIKSAMAVSADKVVAQMESFAPERSGDLVGSIGWVWGSDTPKGSFSLGTLSGKNENELITIFAGNKDAFYARFQEFGTIGMSANPFFFISWRLQKRGVRARMSRAVKKAVK